MFSSTRISAPPSDQTRFTFICHNMCIVKPNLTTRSQTEALSCVDEAQFSKEDSVLSSPCGNKRSPTAVDAEEGHGSTNYEALCSKSAPPPVISHLSMVSREQLKEASDAAEALRRQLVRGSNVLIVQGGTDAKRFIYKRLSELGVNLTIMDGPDSPWQSMASNEILDGFIEVDFSDHDTLYARAMDAITNSKLGTKFDACCTYFEDAVCLTARIATALGLQVNPVEACENARNKRRTREVMAAAGLPSPRFHRIDNVRDVPAACAAVGFPAILKPVFGAASIGVIRVDNEVEAVTRYNSLLRELDPKIDTIWTQGTEVQLEEFYDGDEFDIDLLLSGREAVYAKVSDNCECACVCERFLSLA